MARSMKFLGTVAVLATCAVALPSPARAWWVRGGYLGPRVVLVAPPAFLPPPRIVYVPAPPPRRFWVPAHYDRWGYWVPGRWA